MEANRYPTVSLVLGEVRKAADSEFGQALAVASLVRPKGASCGRCRSFSGGTSGAVTHHPQVVAVIRPTWEIHSWYLLLTSSPQLGTSDHRYFYGVYYFGTPNNQR